MKGIRTRRSLMLIKAAAGRILIFPGTVSLYYIYTVPLVAHSATMALHRRLARPNFYECATMLRNVVTIVSVPFRSAPTFYYSEYTAMPIHPHSAQRIADRLRRKQPAALPRACYYRAADDRPVPPRSRPGSRTGARFCAMCHYSRCPHWRNGQKDGSIVDLAASHSPP
jgi:hypothetical protein